MAFPANTSLNLNRNLQYPSTSNLIESANDDQSQRMLNNGGTGTCLNGQYYHHHSHQFSSSGPIYHDDQTSQQYSSQRTIDYMPTPFTSFTAMLTEGDDADDINALIRKQGEEMRRALADMTWKNYNAFVQASEERVNQKVREKEMQMKQVMLQNAELKQLAEHLNQEARRAETKVRSLERELVITRAQQEYANMEQVAESTDPRPGPNPAHGEQQLFRVMCVACNKHVSNMLTWPCRHVALCKMCDAVERVCPYCLSTKMMSIELVLPMA